MTDLPNKNTFGDEQNLYESMLEKTNKAIKGVGNADVDWFLRDTSVTLTDKPPQDTPDTNNTDMQQKNAPLILTSFSPLLPVLNAHETNLNKSKPSIPSLLDEDVYPNASQDFSKKASSPRFLNRRNSASSTGSISSIDSSSNAGGFFSKLKNRLRSDSVVSAHSQTSDNLQNTHHFKKDYSLTNSNRLDCSIEHSDLSDQLMEKTSSIKPKLCDNTNKGKFDDGDSEDDPRLSNCIQFFRQEDRYGTCMKCQNFDKKVEPVIPLNNSSDIQNQHSKLSSFLRKINVSSQPAKPKEATSTTGSFTDSITSSESQRSSMKVLPDLKRMKPLKHVAFHSQTFLIDPPQQIPSRTPRKGNVEILPSGVVRINPLTEADKVAIEKSLRGQGGGLVVGGSGVLGLVDKNTQCEETEENIANEDKSSEEEDIEVDEHSKSLGIEKTLINMLRKPTYSVPVKKMALDLMYTRCCHLREILPVPAILKQIPPGSIAPLPILQLRNPTPTMVEIQTFADFLRIAPIICISLDGVSLSLEQLNVLLSAMCAKTQLEKLSLRNTPLDTEGWTLLCWFLSRNKVINRLDITQCPPLSLNLLKKKKKLNPEELVIPRMTCNLENRSDMDWSLFTAALIARGGIEELILTGCCINDLTAFKSLIKRAICIKTFKLGLAYNQISPLQLGIVLENWVFSGKCKGLDLGYNDLLSSKYLKIFLNHGKGDEIKEMVAKSEIGFLSLNSTNLRFNDTFKEFFENFIVQLPNLKYLDLSNNPKLFGNFDLSVPPLPKEMKPSCEEATCVAAINEQKNESGSGSGRRTMEKGNIKTFLHGNCFFEDSNADTNDSASSSEVINTYFCSRIPRFKSLARLHLENNGLSSENLKALFEIVPFCKTLNYLSIIGNHLDIYSATSLLQCLRYSISLITVDADYLGLPEMFKEEVGLYSMRNMEQFFNKSISKQSENGEISKSEAFAGSLADELSHLLSRRTDEKLNFQSSEVKNVVKRIQNHRVVLQEAFNDLFGLQYKRELNIEGKETLIRLLFVDSALEWALKLVDSSLVEKDKSVTSSDIINMNSAEDEKNESKAAMLSRVNDSLQAEQSLLAPVGLESLPVSRQQSFSNLSNLDKEEGSALRLLRLGDKNLFQDLSSTSGEDIRRKLLSGNISDLEAVIENISKARDKGIAMKEILNDFVDLDKDDEILSAKHQESDAAKRSPELKGDVSSRNGDKKPDDQRVLDSDIKLLTINDTYDEILRGFNK